MATGVFGKLCLTTYVLWCNLYGNRGLWQALCDNICLVAHSIWQQGLWQALYDNICLVAHSIWQEGSSSSSVWQHLSCGTLYMATGVLWNTLYGNRGLWQALYGNRVFGKLCMTTDVLWHILYGNKGLWQALYDNRCLVAHTIWQEGSSSSSVWQHLSCGTLYMATGVLWNTLYGNRGLVAHTIWQQGSLASSV